MNKHTETPDTHNRPWHITGTDKNVHIFNDLGKRVCTMANNENDLSLARVIETSVNNHGRLVQENERLREDLSRAKRYKDALELIAGYSIGTHVTWAIGVAAQALKG